MYEGEGMHPGGPGWPAGHTGKRGALAKGYAAVPVSEDLRIAAKEVSRMALYQNCGRILPGFSTPTYVHREHAT